MSNNKNFIFIENLEDVSPTSNTCSLNLMPLPKVETSYIIIPNSQTENDTWNGFYNSVISSGNRMPSANEIIALVNNSITALFPEDFDKIAGFTNGNSWIPVIDSQNEWIQVGRNGTIERFKKYSDINGTKPEWGNNNNPRNFYVGYVMTK